jgi:hypothetical protein
MRFFFPVAMISRFEKWYYCFGSAVFNILRFIEDFQMLIEIYLTKIWLYEKKQYFSSPNIVRKKLEFKHYRLSGINFYFSCYAIGDIKIPTIKNRRSL